MQNRTVESGVQLFSRMNSDNTEILNGINAKLFPEGGPSGNQVIEVIFDQEIDYSDFFIDFIVKIILPAKLSEEFKGAQVILLNTDFQINLLKVIKIIERKLEPFDVKSDKMSIVEEALKNIIILDCFSFEQLEITFYNLERIIHNCKNPGLVLLDNMLSQYWCIKFNNFMLSFDEHCIKTLDQLYSKIKDLNVVLMYGRPGLLTESKKKGSQVSYTIKVTKNDKDYVAKVSNLEKTSVTLVSVPFKINVCLEFT